MIIAQSYSLENYIVPKLNFCFQIDDDDDGSLLLQLQILCGNEPSDGVPSLQYRGEFSVFLRRKCRRKIGNFPKVSRLGW